MIELDSAPLPAKRTPKVIIDSTPATITDGWVKSTFVAYVRAQAGLTLLVGGPMNGQRVDLSKLGEGLIVRVPHKRDPDAWTADAFLWYERGEQPGSDARFYCGQDSGASVEISERILNIS